MVPALGSFPVELRLYDISMGLARSMSRPLLGFQIEAIWHSGVFVYGKEYFFGDGIKCLPGTDFQTTFGVQPMRCLEMGMTDITEADFQNFLQAVAPRFTEETYNLLSWNCNNFAEEVCNFLLSKSIPNYVLDLPKSVLATPLGRTFAPLINKFYNKGNTARGDNIPFGAPSVSEAQPAARSHSAGEGTNAARSTSQIYTDIFENVKEELREFASGLNILRMYNVPTARKQMALKLLSTVIQNIIKHPTDPKFRTVKSSNKIVAEKLLGVSGIRECLAGLGFVSQMQNEGSEQEGKEASTSALEAEESASSDGAASNVVLYTLNGTSKKENHLELLKEAKMLVEKLLEDFDNPDKRAQTPVITSSAPSPTRANIEVAGYEEQLALLQEMGFLNMEANLRALRECSGSLERAVVLLDEHNN